MKGFTLIELLIVIAILAILATAVVLVLNPAQILAQARDSQRISDLNSVKSAIALYLATADSPTLTAVVRETASSTTGCPFADCTGIVISSSSVVTGTGWVNGPDLTQTSGGSPLGALPIDPTNNGTYFYGYRGDTDETFKLAGRLESTKYRGQMSSDGGNKNTCDTYTEATCFYETGTDLAL